MQAENIELDYQVATDLADIPNESQLLEWVQAAIGYEAEHGGRAKRFAESLEMTIRVVDLEESQQLNNDYRGKDKPTNVLSFEFENPVGLELPILGDLVIAAEVVLSESNQQVKPLMNHWAHMVVHGCLHLLGYDHINAQDACQMEALEIQILKQLGIDNPYITD